MGPAGGRVHLAALLLEVVEFLASHMHGKLDKGIARAGCRRRAVDRDGDIGQRLIDIASLLVHIGHELVAVGHFRCQRQEELRLGRSIGLPFFDWATERPS